MKAFPSNTFLVGKYGEAFYFSPKFTSAIGAFRASCPLFFLSIIAQINFVLAQNLHHCFHGGTFRAAHFRHIATNSQKNSWPTWSYVL